MTGFNKILAIATPALFSLIEINAQPVWVNGTPAVISTGPLSITVNYGLDRQGTVYIIVFNYNNTSTLSSSYVRTRASSRPLGSVVATSVLQVKKGSEGVILQAVLNVNDAQQVHSIYIVAADTKGILQVIPVRLTATTLACPRADAGTGGNACGRSFVLNAVPVIGQGKWSKVTGPGNASFSPGATSPGATVNVTIYGTYTFRWTETAGNCTSSATVTVNFYQPPVANAGQGGSECDLNFDLNAIPSRGTGRWSMTSGTGTALFVPDASDPGATVSVSVSGTKVFTWTEINGSCINSANVTVNFYQQPVANAGTGGNSCGLLFNMSAIPSVGTGTWTLVSGPGTAVFRPDPHSPNAVVSVTAFGTYTFRWTEVNNNCSASSVITVNFIEKVSANAGNGGNECDRDFMLNAPPGQGTGTWSKISGPGNAVFSPGANHYNAKVTVGQSGDYDFAWTIVNSTCSSTDIIRVTFHEIPSVSAGDDVELCRGMTAQLHATGTGSFLWSPSSLVSNRFIANPVASPLSTTLFTVTLTDQWGCKNSDKVRVEVRDHPHADAGPDQELDFTFEASLEASLPGTNETGEWFVLSGNGVFVNKGKHDTEVGELMIGRNSFIWKVTNGVCPDASDTVNIFVKELLIPSLLTPNQDGKNDFFMIPGLGNLGKTELTIFNRWGARVYSDLKYDNNWDGKDDKGSVLPSDTYYFILKPEKINTIKGYIVIKR